MISQCSGLQHPPLKRPAGIRPRRAPGPLPFCQPRAWLCVPPLQVGHFLRLPKVWRPSSPSRGKEKGGGPVQPQTRGWGQNQASHRGSPCPWGAGGGMQLGCGLRKWRLRGPLLGGLQCSLLARRHLSAHPAPPSLSPVQTPTPVFQSHHGVHLPRSFLPPNWPPCQTRVRKTTWDSTLSTTVRAPLCRWPAALRGPLSCHTGSRNQSRLGSEKLPDAPPEKNPPPSGEVE